MNYVYICRVVFVSMSIILVSKIVEVSQRYFLSFAANMTKFCGKATALEVGLLKFFKIRFVSKVHFELKDQFFQVLKDINLLGKSILITGTTAGIGTETARVLALKGAHVIMANRNVKLSEEVRENIYKEVLLLYYHENMNFPVYL